jgi:alpha-L-rhamnosidase
VPETLVETERREIHPREAPYPEYARIPAPPVASGKADPPAPDWRYDGGSDGLWFKLAFKPGVGHFPVEEIETGALSYVAGAKFHPGGGVPPTGRLNAGEWRIHDLGRNLSGFPGARIRTSGPARIAFVFDELLVDGDVPLHRLGCNNVADVELTGAGEYDFAFFDPVTCRYIKIAVISGAAEVDNVLLVEYANPEAGRAEFNASDRDLCSIFEAARQTFRQNAVDVFTDCPSRERAGWLCDSFFIGRAASVLCGNTAMEHTFLQNFLLSKYTGDIPDAVFPMCYPGDHVNNNYIPNWAMWFVAELEEYVARSGDKVLAKDLEPRVRAFLSFLAAYENSDGLLEKLPRWVFVEWSRANDLVQDVNYPSNMTYSGILAAAGRLYGDASLTAKSARVAETIRAQSYDGLFFRDHAIRGEDGVLTVDSERTEVCQYYAFFFGVATIEAHAELWRVLREDFGPFRRETGAHPDVAYANAFIGNYLRLELLSRAGLTAQILRECKGYFKKMADLTGTLWEMDSPTASCCHGFASHAACMILRDVLGIRRVDAVRKTVEIAIPSDLPLEWCEGSRPVADGEIRVAWRRASGGVPEAEVSVPAGWKWIVP